MCDFGNFQKLRIKPILYLYGLGAGEGNRTLVLSLGSSRSTIELHPRWRDPRNADGLVPQRQGTATIVAHLTGSATQNNGLRVGTPLLCTP